MTLSIKGLLATLSINDTQYNSNVSKAVRLRVALLSLLCTKNKYIKITTDNYFKMYKTLQLFRRFIQKLQTYTNTFTTTKVNKIPSFLKVVLIKTVHDI